MRFMVRFEIVGEREQFAPLIPAEMERVAELRRAGVIEELYLAKSGGLGWIVMTGNEPAEVDAALATLPLFPFLATEITELR